MTKENPIVHVYYILIIWLSVNEYLLQFHCLPIVDTIVANMDM